MTETRGYHPYVFDEVNRRFVGQFEDMYRAEQREGFDSWHQDDLRNLTKRICLEVLRDHTFGRVLDLGCGKGAFTQQLVGATNDVIGVDLSETALSVARTRCPRATFVQADVGSAGTDLTTLAGGRVDLVVCLETLSYLERWRQVIEAVAALSRHVLLTLYVPPNPIGFITSRQELADVFVRSFTPIEDLRLETRQQIVLFGESRSAPPSR